MEHRGAGSMEPLLVMDKVTKKFGSLTANQDISLKCFPGEVIALLGENGAGKTTLMKVLYGMYKPDSGIIMLKGKKVQISCPRVAIDLGIQMVHQHFMLVQTLTVAENVVMGKEPHYLGLLQTALAEKKVDELSAMYGLQVEPQKAIQNLSVGEQQRVEIIKALYQGAEILILDEPTAVLTPQETEELFNVIRNLKASGKTVIIITHKLKETLAISDRIYVLRDGKLVGEKITSNTNAEELTELMVGRKIGILSNEKRCSAGPPIVQAEKLKLTNKMGVHVLREINFQISAGEILGIAGVEGNGQLELAEILSGIESGWEGEIRLQNESMKGKSTGDLLASGVACIHGDRHKRGLVLSLPAVQNFFLGYQNQKAYHKKPYIVDWSKVESITSDLLKEYDVRPLNTQMPAANFSGGNQQKLVVARELKRNPLFLIAVNPTRGVDIGAADFIHQKLLEFKKRGAAIILISSDLDEIFKLSDHIAVLFEGTIVATRPAEDFTELELGHLMGGGGKK